MQAIVAVVLTLALGIVQSQYVEAYRSVNFIVNKKAEKIEGIFNHISNNLISISGTYNTYINQYLAKNKLQNADLKTNHEIVQKIFLNKAVDLTNFLYANPDVSGIFIILGVEQLQDKDDTNPCLYIRKRTQEVTSYSTEDYWVLRFGNPSVASKLNIQLDYLWTYYLNLPNTEDGVNREFFNKPFNDAIEHKNSTQNCYISKPFRISAGDIEIITQTIPLIDDDGNPYGVMGVEMSLDSLEKQISKPELPNIENGFYVLTDNNISNFSNIFIDSNSFSKVFLGGNKLGYKLVDKENNIYLYENKNSTIKKMLGTSVNMKLYNRDSPYRGEQYTLYGFVPEHQLLQSPNGVRSLIIYLGILFLVFSLLSAIVASISAIRPILKLSEKVASIDADMPIVIEPTGIAEIDQLSKALERLGIKVTQSASRLSSIINLFEKPIAGFEENEKENRVYVTESILRIFNIPFIEKNFISFEQWESFKLKLIAEKVKDYEDVFQYIDEHKTLKYIQLNIKEEEGKTFGVIIDVTNEVLQKQKLEYERDVDGLTKLLNRVAFYNKASEAIGNDENKIGALIFLDMDNLKFINDNYGHECGDEYIKLMANSLLAFIPYNGIVARISGDEFVVFIHGFDGEEQIKEIYTKVLKASGNKYITLPDHSFYKLRASAGISWYPRDTTDLSLLMKYADFAMYEVKHSNKGNTKEFDLESYDKNSFLTSKMEVLNTFIENKLLYFVFQPIVDASTGKIVAYEALMRSHHNELTSPLQILQLAKAQSKQYQLEKLVITTAIRFVNEHGDELRNKKIFFNSIPSICLTEKDFKNLTEISRDNSLSKMVMEIITVEEGENEKYLWKLSKMRELGVQITLDEFSSRYNDITFMSSATDFIKIDKNVIHGIHLDNNKKQIVENIISYASPRGIKVIAQGVEIKEDLEVLAQMGVNYYQGFLLYRPKPHLVEDNEEVKKMVFYSKKRW